MNNTQGTNLGTGNIFGANNSQNIYFQTIKSQTNNDIIRHAIQSLQNYSDTTNGIPNSVYVSQIKDLIAALEEKSVRKSATKIEDVMGDLESAIQTNFSNDQAVAKKLFTATQFLIKKMDGESAYIKQQIETSKQQQDLLRNSMLPTVDISLDGVINKNTEYDNFIEKYKVAVEKTLGNLKEKIKETRGEKPTSFVIEDSTTYQKNLSRHNNLTTHWVEANAKAYERKSEQLQLAICNYVKPQLESLSIAIDAFNLKLEELEKNAPKMYTMIFNNLKDSQKEPLTLENVKTPVEKLEKIFLGDEYKVLFAEVKDLNTKVEMVIKAVKENKVESEFNRMTKDFTIFDENASEKTFAEVEKILVNAQNGKEKMWNEVKSLWEKILKNMGDDKTSFVYRLNELRFLCEKHQGEIPWGYTMMTLPQFFHSPFKKDNIEALSSSSVLTTSKAESK